MAAGIALVDDRYGAGSSKTGKGAQLGSPTDVGWLIRLRGRYDVLDTLRKSVELPRKAQQLLAIELIPCSAGKESEIGGIVAIMRGAIWQ